MKTTNLENMLEVCSGKLTLLKINEELKDILEVYAPSRIIVDVQLKEPIGYFTQIYISVPKGAKK